MVLEVVLNGAEYLWESIIDFILLLMIIVYLLFFFAVQYLLYLGYKWVFQSIWNMPIVKNNVIKIFKQFKMSFAN